MILTIFIAAVFVILALVITIIEFLHIRRDKTRRKDS